MKSSPAPSDPPQVLIGIPTYRRPDTLGRLLDSLRADLAASDLGRQGRVRILIADNACDPHTAQVVRAHDPGVPYEIKNVSVPGYSAVRNALVAGALADPETSWLICLDDDSLVESPWLDTMVEAAQRYDADLIGGPVVGDLPPGSSRLARNSLYASRPRFKTGPVASLNGNCNVGMARRLLERIPHPVFDLALGRTGGEDYEFFCRARALGARIIWCDEAVVVEPTPDERLSNRALLSRIRNSNRTSAQIDIAHKGVAGSLRTTAQHSLWTVKAIGAGVLRRQPDRLFEAVNKAAGVLGRAEGLAQHALGRGYRK